MYNSLIGKFGGFAGSGAGFKYVRLLLIGQDGSPGTGPGGTPSDRDWETGVVITKEPFVGSSVWDLKTVYRKVKENSWSN